MMTTGVRQVPGFAASAGALALGDWMVIGSGAGIRNAAHHTASVSTAQTKLRQRGTARIAAPRECRAITAAR